MQDSDIPDKFTIPFANGAGPSFIRTVPVPSQIGIQNGAASFTDGFPPLTFDPVASGGVPPFGQDMNGILNSFSSWLRWMQAGGPAQYDSTFSSAVGGYPKGALLLSTSGHVIFESTADNNTTNPNSGGANWIVAACPWTQKCWQAAGSANIQTLTLSPVPTLAQLVGVPIAFISQGANTTAGVTLNVNGLGAKSIVSQSNGATLGIGQFSLGYVYTVMYNGTVFVLLDTPSVFGGVVVGGAGVTASTGNVAASAGQVVGQTGVTANTGNVTASTGQVIAHTDVVAATGGVFALAGGVVGQTGVTANTGNVTASAGQVVGQTGVTANTGNVTASVGKLRAGLQSGGDANAAVLLAEFNEFWGVNPERDFGFWQGPKGLVMATFALVTTSGAGLDTFVINLPTAFPSYCGSAICSFRGGTPPQASNNPGISVQPTGNTTQVSLTVNSTGIASVSYGIVIYATGF